MKNKLWCVTQRLSNGEFLVYPEEVFSARSEARNYLRDIKSRDGCVNCNKRDVFLRQIEVNPDSKG